MTAKTTAAGVPYDAQGTISEPERREAAMAGNKAIGNANAMATMSTI